MTTEKVYHGVPCLLAASFTYDSRFYCFQKETIECCRSFLRSLEDDICTSGGLPHQQDDADHEQRLLIPPSSWDRLIPLLEKAPLVHLEHNGSRYHGICLSNDPLSLQFVFSQTGEKGYQLKITGLDQLIVLKDYRFVLTGGKLIQLKMEECERLSELKRMLAVSRNQSNRNFQGAGRFFS